MSGTLLLCSTPIGNLGDAPQRLADELASVDVVYAEDTRHSATLLKHLGVAAPIRSYFAGNEDQRSTELEQRLQEGQRVALVTDAGTPAISDPGYSAVHAARRAGATITVVPGASAVTAAVAVSGLPSERFVFEGFLPRKGAKRADRLAELAREPRTVVLFSAPSRLRTDLEALQETVGTDRPLTVARELTKLHEEIWSGTVGDALEHFAAPRGEFTLVVAGSPSESPDLGEAVHRVKTMTAEGVPFNEAVKTVAELVGARRNDLYRAALDA